MNLPLDEQCDCKLIDGDKLIEFFVVEDTLLEENEDLLEKLAYNLEEVE
jgi:hypothetical protein